MSKTTKWLLDKPQRGSLYWDIPLNSNADLIDNILYKLRTSFSGDSEPTENADSGSLWFDELNTLLKVKLPSGFKQILTLDDGDVRYVKQGSETSFTSVLDFTNATLKWFDQATGNIALLYFSASKFLTFEFGDTPGVDKIIFKWTGTDGSYSILDLLSNQITAYKNLVVPNATASTHAVNKGQADSLYVSQSTYTATDILTKLKTVDGTGSGLDSDLLDGQEGSFYRNASNLNSGTIPLAQIPTTLTGKSADQVDGFHASQSVLTDTIPVRDELGSLLIAPKVSSGASDPLNNYVSYTGSSGFNITSGGSIILSTNVNKPSAFGSMTKGLNDWVSSKFYFNTNTKTYDLWIDNNNTSGQTISWVLQGSMWHSGNDGSGSGLDADKIDGIEGSSLVIKTSTNRPGVTKLYRTDGDSAYNVQTNWDGTYWNLKGYNNDTYHAPCKVAYADVAGSVAGGGGGFTNMVVFNTSTNWTVPAGITKIWLKVYGAGGGGGYGYVSAGIPPTTYTGGGGGAGGYSEGFMTVTPSAAIYMNVGIGGSGGTALVTPATAGGSSEVYYAGQDIIATGGGAGAQGSNVNNAGGSGGAGNVYNGIAGKSGGQFGHGGLSYGIGYGGNGGSPGSGSSGNSGKIIVYY